jgi:hypothetical protein
VFDDISKLISGWHPSPPDARDWMYHEHIPVSPATVAALPDAVDLSAASPFPVWNQGNIGSCGPQTACRDVLYAGLLEGLRTVPEPSRLFWYYCAREIMGTVDRDSGVYNRALCQVASKFGWCDEARWEYAPVNFRTRPPAEAYVQAAARKCEKYLAVEQRLDVMKTAIANGDPIIFGFTVFQNIAEAARNGGVIPMPAGRAAGGHDVLVVGYDDRTRRFKVCNSWGAEWGDGGYGYVPYDYALNPRYAGDFWTIQGSGLPKPVPPEPAPPNPPAPHADDLVHVDPTRKRVMIPKGWTAHYPE